MRKLSSFHFLLIAGSLVLSLGACFKSPEPPSADSGGYYTCTMHPSVHSKDPGKCPLCSMDLVLVTGKTADVPAAEGHGFTVPVERQQQIGVTYAVAETRPLSRTVRGIGTMDQDGAAWVSFGAGDGLRVGQTVTVRAVARPGREFAGIVGAIDPGVDGATQTVRARLNVEPPDGALQPGLFVSAEFATEPVTALAVPVSAVMPTGLRNHVFVDKGEGRLEPRLVTLGARYGDFYAVASGLTAGERVVSSANFLIDAESQVQGALKGFGHE